MDAHKDSLQFSRLEVVDRGRRRRWTEDVKERVVEESCSGHGQVAATARRYGIARALLAKWRKQFGVTRAQTAGALPVSDAPAKSGTFEILLPNGLRLSVSADIEPRRLRQIVKALG